MPESKLAPLLKVAPLLAATLKYLGYGGIAAGAGGIGLPILFGAAKVLGWIRRRRANRKGKRQSNYKAPDPPSEPAPASGGPHQYVEVPVDGDAELYRQALDLIAKTEYQHPSFQRFHKLVEHHFNLLKSGKGRGNA